MSLFRITSLAAASFAVAVTAGSVLAQSKPKPKLTEAQARKIAAREVPTGRVQSAELEQEHGHLIYSFDIKVAGKSGIEEINVDAMNGKVLAHEHEGPAAERQEAKAEGEGTRKPKP